MKVVKLKFLKKKYGRELLIDCSLFSEQHTTLIDAPFIIDFYGIFFITRGKGKLLWENKSIDFQQGYLLFFQPGQIRRWENVTKEFDGYFLVFEKEFIETFFQDPHFIHRFQFFNPNKAGYVKIDEHYFSQLCDLCVKIRKELTLLEDDSNHLLRSVLYQILIEINREYCKSYNLPLSLFKDNTTLQFLQLITRHIRNYKKVDDYCELLNISRSHLNQLLKKSTGQTASEYIKERLVFEIKQELLYTDKSVKQICFDMNFDEISNFIRFFKKATGINPGLYRLQNSN